MPSTDGQAAAPILLSHNEEWANPSQDDLPTLEDVLDQAGLRLLGSVDAPDPAPLVVPGPLFVKIQAADREVAIIAARRQELMELAIDLLGVDRAIYRAVIDLDTGAVALSPHEVAAS